MATEPCPTCGTPRTLPDPPIVRCSICETPEKDTEWQHLTDVRVIVSDREEGFADITMLLCDDHNHQCLETVIYGLKKLGFRDHRHGSTNLLEDDDCVGYGKCLTPTEYGRVWIGNPELKEGV